MSIARRMDKEDAVHTGRSASWVLCDHLEGWDREGGREGGREMQEAGNKKRKKKRCGTYI